MSWAIYAINNFYVEAFAYFICYIDNIFILICTL